MLFFIAGYALGKDKIQIVKKQKLTQEEKQQLIRIEKEQKEALERFNATVKQINTYDNL